MTRRTVPAPTAAASKTEFLEHAIEVALMPGSFIDWRAKDRLLLALRILAERPVPEPSHDEVLHAILGIDIKAARKAGRDRRKRDTKASTEPKPANRATG